MLKKIILISGKARSGKNAAADFMSQHLRNNAQLSFAKLLKDYSFEDFNAMTTQINQVLQEFNKTVQDLKFANKGDQKKFDIARDELYKHLMTKDTDQWYNDKNLITRNILQLYGTEVVRERFGFKNYWIDNLIKEIKSRKEEYYLVTDWRFKNEVIRMKAVLNSKSGLFNFFADNYKIVTVRIVSNRTEMLSKSHKSELDLEDFNFDHTIENNGTLSDLQCNVVNFLDQLKIKKKNPTKPQMLYYKNTNL